jgi:hypothetical protein
LDLSSLPQLLDGLIHQRLLGFELFGFDPGNFVLLDLVGRVALELVVGELLLGRHRPAPQTPEDLVGLGLGMHVFQLGFLGTEWRVCFSEVGGGVLCSLFLLLVLLLFLLLLGSLILPILLARLLLIVRRVGFLLSLFVVFQELEFL